mgnify:FL=1
MQLVIKFLATLGFSGYTPKIPGTVGSFLAAVLLYFWQLKFALMPFATLLALVIIFILGVWLSTKMEEMTGKHDPQEVVIDEMMGLWIALLFIPFNIVAWGIGFILFRVFDIWKPWLIGKAQDLEGGYGIMMDDILAGVVTNIILTLIIGWII